MFDVGAIARRIQTEFRLVCPPNMAPQRCAESEFNRATPGNVLELLDELGEVTDAVVQEVEESSISGAARVGFLIDLARWRERLAAYRTIAKAAPVGDRAFISNDVTAPLLLGYFPGQQFRKPIDATTPFRLANQQEVDESFRDELWESFLADLKTNAADLVKPLAFGVGFGALAVGGLALALVLRK